MTERLRLMLASTAVSVLFWAAVLALLTGCTSSGGQYWSQVAGATGQQVAKPPERPAQ